MTCSTIAVHDSNFVGCCGWKVICLRTPAVLRSASGGARRWVCLCLSFQFQFIIRAFLFIEFSGRLFSCRLYVSHSRMFPCIGSHKHAVIVFTFVIFWLTPPVKEHSHMYPNKQTAVAASATTTNSRNCHFSSHASNHRHASRMDIYWTLGADDMWKRWTVKAFWYVRVKVAKYEMLSIQCDCLSVVDSLKTE